ncbi:hemolysin family protein [Sphingosinicella sp.]|uniref:hemolysin family protein n=1 Tax=Sphingosinicella sp. TaxID=1917971 RepID=UPI004037F922
MSPTSPLQPFPWLDVVIILALVGLNGLFAMSELAIVSSRRGRLRALAKQGAGARRALALAADPGRFLSTVQIGITLIGIVAGAYSGASLGAPVGQRLALLGLEPDTARSLGFALVIIVTTYASLIIGELVPKQFALRSPESIAIVVATPMLWLSRATAPIVWLLDNSSALIFRLLRLNRESEDQVTAEDLHLVVAEAATAGVLEESERHLISSVVRLADRPAREVMTPRTDIAWIDADADQATIRAQLIAAPHNRIPIAEGNSVDRLIGVVQARDVVDCLLMGEEINLRKLMKPAPIVPDQLDAMDAMTVLRDSDVPMAFVHDEYGHFEGIVTPGNLLTALTGQFLSSAELDHDPPLIERDDGSWWVSGSVSADALADRLCIKLPEDRDYATAAGFALSVLRHIPDVGEKFSFAGWRFEIVDMDGRKIDKLLASEIQRARRVI